LCHYVVNRQCHPAANRSRSQSCHITPQTSNASQCRDTIPHWHSQWHTHYATLSSVDSATPPCELEQAAQCRFTHEPNRRLAAHLRKHAMHWFWFLIDPKIQATNHWAEQAIRPAVVNRKVWGGNRTWSGARAQSILMSVIRTCQQRAVEPFAFLLDAICRTKPQLLPV
jgi:hypothetical protein